MSAARSGPSHPLCIVMTGVLLLNDHVLKPTVPGWVTGKLSDMAFLVVAPAVLAALLSWARAPEKVARATSLITVGAAFVLLQVWPPFGDTLAAWLGGRHTPDLTDLFTLPVLTLTPLVWRPAKRLPLALPTAAFACLATSYGYCDSVRYPIDGGVIDPNEPLWLRFGGGSPAPDHPSLARNVEVRGPDGERVPLWFAWGIAVCPQGGLRPNTTYTFTVHPLEDDLRDNTYGAYFGPSGTTTFRTLGTSVLPPIDSQRACEAARPLGELPPCFEEWEDTGLRDTGLRDTGSQDTGL